MRSQQLSFQRFKFFLIRKPDGSPISAGERWESKHHRFKPILEVISIGTPKDWLESFLALSRFHKQQLQNQNIYWHIPLITEFEDAVKTKMKGKAKKIEEHVNLWGLWEVKI
jgi:hypothetical protein